MGGKVRHLKSLSSNSAASLPGSRRPCPSDQIKTCQDDNLISENTKQEQNSRQEDPKEASSGPHTSLFFTFLFSLFACSEAGVRSGDDKPIKQPPDKVNREIAADHKIIGNQCQAGTSTSGQNLQRASSNTILQTNRGVDKIVTSKRDVGPLMQTDSQDQVQHQQNVEVFMLPSLSEPSLLLSDALRRSIMPALPTLVWGRQWTLIYSTRRHGISLLTLYRNSSILPGPCLLVTGDSKGAVFGALLSAPLKPTPKKKYQGTSETFVFTNVSGEPVLYHSTGTNRFYVLCTNDALALGGGGQFALHLDNSLLNGSSGSCATFGNNPLAHSPEFVVKDVELWGFSHSSRYLP